MTREQEIKQRLAAVDYRSHVDAVFAADIKYLLGRVETFEQVKSELEGMWQARVEVLESVNNALVDNNTAFQIRNAHLEAQLLEALVNPPAYRDPEEAGTTTPSETTQPESTPSQEQPPVDGGSGSDLEPQHGQEEPTNPTSGNSGESIPSDPNGAI